MEEDQLFSLIKKYLAGQCTAEEKIQIENWYEQQERNSDAFYQNDATAIADSYSRSLAVIQAEMQQDQLATRKDRIRRLQHYSKWAVAACVLVCSITAFYFYTAKSPATKYNEVIVSAGHVLHFKLADNSYVSLNAGSHLKYPQTFTGKTRDIYLEGEAWFDVSHDASHPFRVHTSRLTTTVLGTAFSVTAFKHAASQSVTVMRGKVKVADNNNTIGFITPDRRVVYQLSSKKGVISSVDAASLMSWKNGQLEFADQEMEDIAERLARWYGYAFKLDNLEMRKCRYTASFNNQISMKDMLDVMKAISQINYKIDHENKTVTLYGSGCNK